MVPPDYHGEKVQRILEGDDMTEKEIVQALQRAPRGPVWMCGEQLPAYSRGRLVYVADLGQIMLAKLTPGREEAK